MIKYLLQLHGQTWHALTTHKARIIELMQRLHEFVLNRVLFHAQTDIDFINVGCKIVMRVILNI